MSLINLAKQLSSRAQALPESLPVSQLFSDDNLSDYQKELIKVRDALKKTIEKLSPPAVDKQQ